MFRFDESDPHYLIAYDSGEEANIASYEELGARWITRFEHGHRFGVILVTEAFHHHHHDDDDDGHDHDDHDHDHDHERDVAFEEAFTKLLNEFRRQYKTEIERYTVAYARVMPADWVAEQVATNPDYIAEMQAYTDRMAQYMWGVPGGAFGNVDDARRWMKEQIDIAASAPTTPRAAQPEDKGSWRVGLFYGSTTGATEAAAYHICEVWEALGLEALQPQNIGTVKDLSALMAYDYLILGIPTWNVGQLQDDWEIAFPQLDTLDFTGKRVALFGVGDQYGYPDNFLDAVGMLGHKLIERGAQLLGLWDTQSYEFAESKALMDGKFMGLGIDEDSQPELTAERVTRWVAQIAHEFALQPSTAV